MNTRHSKLLVNLILVLGLITLSAAYAKDDVTVTEADPPFTDQGTYRLDVNIYGSGFDETADVLFVVEGTKRNSGGIVVNQVTHKGNSHIVANIDVPATAEVAGYNIEVRMSRGRGGKGTTTLFSVFEKKDIKTCQESFPDLSDPSQCDCIFTWNEERDQGTPPNRTLIVQKSCYTHETLQLGQYQTLSSKNYDTLTAAYPFTGEAVVTASGHRAKIFNIHINIGQGVAAGCDQELRSAVAFVLDGDSVLPHVPAPGTESVYRRTRLWIWGNTISTSGEALCDAIEFTRTQDYNNRLPSLPGGPQAYDDAIARVSGILITSGSYERTGVLLRGFIPDPTNVHTEVSVKGNTIEPGDKDNAVAIRFGPVFGPGEILRNVISLDGGTAIHASGDCTGIVSTGACADLPVLGGGANEISITLNDVFGADTAILVNEYNQDAFFKSNILTGDGDPGTGDTGICSFAGINDYKANKINGFDYKILESGCGPSP